MILSLGKHLALPTLVASIFELRIYSHLALTAMITRDYQLAD
jgi:hypothetical protein